MKADPTDQRLMADLADLDAELARLRHRRKTLPEEAEYTELQSRLETARDDVVRAEIASEDLGREYSRLDSELVGMTDRAAKNAGVLEQGKLSHRALEELQHEMTGLARRRSLLEEELLELMERQEATATEHQRAQATVIAVQTDLSVAEARLAEAVRELQLEQAGITERREQLAESLPDTLLALYQRQVDAGKIGAGLLRGRRCGACRMELDPMTVANIGAKPADEVVRCEECGAILVRTPDLR